VTSPVNRQHLPRILTPTPMESDWTPGCCSATPLKSSPLALPYFYSLGAKFHLALHDVTTQHAFWCCLMHYLTQEGLLCTAKSKTCRMCRKTRRTRLLLPDDCQPQKAEDSDTSDVQAVPLQRCCCSVALVVLVLKIVSPNDHENVFDTARLVLRAYNAHACNDQSMGSI